MMYVFFQASTEVESLRKQIAKKEKELSHQSESLTAAKSELEAKSSRIKELELQLDGVTYKNK